MIWILDEDLELAFEWNESATVNVYPMDTVYDPDNSPTVTIWPVSECFEHATKMNLDDFKMFVEDWKDNH